MYYIYAGTQPIGHIVTENAYQVLISFSVRRRLVSVHFIGYYPRVVTFTFAVHEMSRRKVDNRVRVLIENGVALRYRIMFVIVGDKGRDQVSVL